MDGRAPHYISYILYTLEEVPHHCVAIRIRAAAAQLFSVEVPKYFFLGFIRSTPACVNVLLLQCSGSRGTRCLYILLRLLDSRRSRDPQCVSFSAASLSSCDTSRGFFLLQYFIDSALMSDQFFTFAESACFTSHLHRLQLDYFSACLTCSSSRCTRCLCHFLRLLDSRRSRDPLCVSFSAATSPNRDSSAHSSHRFSSRPSVRIFQC